MRRCLQLLVVRHRPITLCALETSAERLDVLFTQLLRPLRQWPRLLDALEGSKYRRVVRTSLLDERLELCKCGLRLRECQDLVRLVRRRSFDGFEKWRQVRRLESLRAIQDGKFSP